MRSIHRKLALGLAAGITSLGLFGAAAFGAFGPDASATAGLTIPDAAAAVGKDRPDKLQAVLATLVQKGVITQAQADAILAALKDTAARVKPAAVLREFYTTSAQYLGIAEKDLRAKLAGTTLGAIANATAGRSRDGLVEALNREGNADIERALANGRITSDQAQKLRGELPAGVTAFVDRSWPTRPAVSVRIPSVKTFLGDLLPAGRDYLGLPLQDVTAQMRSGKTFGEIADGIAGKNRAGLIAALVTAANTRIDQAVTNNKITAEQATALKTRVTAEVTSFVDRKLAIKSNTTRRSDKP